MTTTPFKAQWHLRAELARLVTALGEEVRQQRQRGRTPAADAIGGYVIEDGEAEGLVAELIADLSDREPPVAARTHPSRASEVGRLAGPAAGARLPLQHAVRAFDLEPAEYDTLLLAVAVECDARVGRLVAYLNDHAGHTRPTLGLAASLSRHTGAAPTTVVELVSRPIVTDGLIEIEGDGPLPGVTFRIARSLLPRLTDRPWADAPEGPAYTAPEPGRLPALVLDVALRERLTTWVDAVRHDHDGALMLLHGAPGSGRRTLARALASALGIGLVEMDLSAGLAPERLREVRRDARWYDAAAFVKIDDPANAAAPGLLWQLLAPVRRPVFVAIPTAALDAATAAAPRDPIVIEVPEPDGPLRVAIWRALLPRGVEIADADVERLAARFRFNPGHIARAVGRARADLALQPAGARHLDADRLQRAARDVGSAAMGPLAQKLPLPYRPEELIVPAAVRAELDLSVAWVQHQPMVLDRWRFADRLPTGRGLTALFAGEPGTGKTMAAQILARVLGLDLFRVDLSRVMNKYIGETEKQLARLFDEAHAAGAILLLDEGEVLIGKRSEVRDAHDRYANVEIAYLLQRMEQHDGVTVLTTNRMRDIDEAFIRRFHVIIDFPMPDAADRLRIWSGMLPAAAARDADVDLGQLARRFELSGGEIKNAALAAAYVAAAEGTSIHMRHLVQAVRREMRKNGKVVTDRDSDAPRQ